MPRNIYANRLNIVWDKIASIFIGGVLGWCVILGVYACVSSVVEFRNYYDLDDKYQTIQGNYVSYEVDYPGRYGATKRFITVDDQQYKIRTDEVEEASLKNDIKQGDVVTLIIDPEEKVALAIYDEQNVYLSYETSKNTIKQIATSGMMMGLAFIAAGVIIGYFYFVHPHRRRKWRKS